MKPARLELANPVIRGFAPDPSIVRIGEWYFVAVSSFEWFPTIPLHRSRDLVTWEYAGHVETAAPEGQLRGYPDSGGIWAPALSYADGMLWVTYSIVESVQKPYFDLETFVARAQIVDGLPQHWRPAVKVSGHGFDPSLFHADGRHWLLNLQNDHRPGGDRFAGIVITELIDDDGVLMCTGPTTLLLQRHNLLEGPKLLHQDGWHYLTLAEGGTGVEHGVLMARSRELLGPYVVDSQPLLTTRDDPSWPLQKAGHGEFVQAPNGEWFLCHLASRPIATDAGPQNPLGRETAIQAITWETDDWPRLAQGGWHPAVIVSVPGAEPGEPTSTPSAPAAPWSSLREPIDGDWARIDPASGSIRLRGRQSVESLRRASLLGRRITEHRTVAEVTVEAHPRSFAQGAGLLLWYNSNAYLGLQLTWSEPEGEPQRGQQFAGLGRTTLVLTSRSTDGAVEIARIPLEIAPPGTAGRVRLRARLDHGVAQFAAGVPGDELFDVGPALDASFLSDDFGPTLRFTGTFAAIAAVDLIDEAFSAEFSHFTLTCSEGESA